MTLIWRYWSYVVTDDSNINDNWANYEWVNREYPEKIFHKELTKWTNYWIRTNDFPYDIPKQTKEHLMILSLWNRLPPQGLQYIIQEMWKLWYIVFQQPKDKQSKPDIFHLHCLKY